METRSGEKFAERMEFADLYDCYGQMLTEQHADALLCVCGRFDYI